MQYHKYNMEGVYNNFVLLYTYIIILRLNVISLFLIPTYNSWLENEHITHIWYTNIFIYLIILNANIHLSCTKSAITPQRERICIKN